MYTAMYMPAMIRKQIYIEPSQDRQLKRMAKQTGKTQSEMIRKALDLRFQAAERETGQLKQDRAAARPNISCP